MKKASFIIVFLLTCIQAGYAQDNSAKNQEKDSTWTTNGDISLLFSQAAFNAEWQGGGTSNYAGNVSLQYEINYNKENFTWSTQFLGEFGLTHTKGNRFFRKTNDKVEVNSTAGYKIDDSNWYYSFFANFKSQFAPGYEYSENNNGVTVRTEQTHFLSPGYLKFGPGLLYKKNKNFKVNIAPATARFILVDDYFTTTPVYVDGDYYGVDQGQTTRFEFGASVNIIANFQIAKNVAIHNNLTLYSNYLEEPKNVDLDYTFKLDLKVNDYISANFVFQTIYDDNAVAAFQVREVLGVGLNYDF